MENNLYEDLKIQNLIKELKEYFLTTSTIEIQNIYSSVDLDELEWFFAKNTSYIDYKELRNELFGIKYKIYKKKFDSIISALQSGIDCSGLLNDKQIIHFQGDKNISNYKGDIYYNDCLIHFLVDENLKNIKNKISIFKQYKLNESEILTIGISGEYGERSSLELNTYSENRKIKTITSKNDELHFNKFNHKLYDENFYDYDDKGLKRIFFIGKDKNEVDIYKRK